MIDADFGAGVMSATPGGVRMRRLVGLGAIVAGLSFGCGPSNDGGAPPLPDEDGDSIADEQEGRVEEVDTDLDGTPDYLDDDSDGDGVPDVVEAGDADTHTAPP